MPPYNIHPWYKTLFEYLYRWSRSCSELLDKLYNYADNSLSTGYLGIKEGVDDASLDYRVPGTILCYKNTTAAIGPIGDQYQSMI